MAEEKLTRVAGRVAQLNDAPFFLMNLADIAAADVMNVESAFGTTSLRDFLIFQNPDMTSTNYDLYVDKSKIIISTFEEDPIIPPEDPIIPPEDPIIPPEDPIIPPEDPIIPPEENIVSSILGIAILGSTVLGYE